MYKIAILSIAGAMLCATASRAATITAASCSLTDVNTAIASASNGDTVVIPGGSVTWGSTLTLTKAITLNGGGCSVIGVITFTTVSGFNTRITDFTWLGTGVSITATQVAGDLPCRIDTNTFESENTVISISGNGTCLIDHNTFTNELNEETIHNTGDSPGCTSCWTNDVVPGSPNQVYVETNTFTFDATGTLYPTRCAATPGCPENTSAPYYFWGNSAVQSYYGSRTVMRYNTMNMAQIDQHGSCGSVYARWWELYGNTFHVIASGNQSNYFHLRGGSGVVFGNTAPDQVSNNLGAGSLGYDDDCTTGSYPTPDQVGRGISQNASPAYSWNNTSNITVGSGSSFVQAGRDYFNTTSPPAMITRCESAADVATGCPVTYSYIPFTYPYPLTGAGFPDPSGASGGCLVGIDNSGCPCNPVESPCVQSYIGNLTTVFVSLLNGAATHPQPIIGIGGEVVPMSSSFRNADTTGCQTPTNTCVFSTAAPSTVSGGLNEYVDQAILGAGDGYADVNGDTVYYFEATEYATYCGSSCGTPGTPARQTYQLSQDDLAYAHIKTDGLNIRVAFAPLPNTFSACGLTSSSMTAAQAAACFDPIAQTYVAHMIAKGNIPTDVTPWHEPQGYTNLSLGQKFSVSDFNYLISQACNAIHAVSGASGINCGGGFGGNDSTYIACFLNGTGCTKPTGVNFLGLDVYNGVNPASYASTFAVYAGFCAAAHAVGYKCKANESDPPRDVPSTSSSGSEQFAYYGCADPMWQQFGVNNAFAIIPRIASGYGFDYWSRFSTQPNAGFDPTASDNCFSSALTGAATAYVMEHLSGPTTAALGWQIGTAWQAVAVESLTGFSNVLIQ